MNKYPVWWSTTITLYNRHENKETGLITWYRTVIPNCFWKYIGNKIAFSNYYSANNSMVLETSDTICRIPINPAYLDNYEWDNVPNDQRGDYFTFKIGDIIANGDIEEEINEYLAGHRSTDFIAKYKERLGCIEITKFANFSGPGRVNEHYYIKGV